LFGELDPNKFEDLCLILEILDDQEIEYRIDIKLDPNKINFELLQNNLSEQFVSTEINFWQQVYFDYYSS
jgi:Ni/Fe-hydrogenase subunit HybB-like protein